MSRVEHEIQVDVPVTTAYNQYTQFESFPKFMEGVENVVQTDPTTLHWKAEIGGDTREWDARITHQVPDQVIAWESVSGPTNNGTVTFEPCGPECATVHVAMDYEPEGMAETVGDKLGFVSRRVKGDLERFKGFVESRGVETGAWRGEVQGGRTV
jgi:uncharacterized membrane protein